MQDERGLAGIFTVLLFGVIWPAGCNRASYGGQCRSYEDRQADPAAIAEALREDGLSVEECVVLCDRTPEATDPTTSGGTCTSDETTGMSSSGTTGSSSSGTEPGGTGETGSSGEADTGGGGSSSTETGGTGEVCPDAGLDEEEDYDEPIVGCRAFAEYPDIIRCEIADCVYGRRPAGLRSGGRALASDGTGLWFAEAAHLEAASVPAFERLAAALAMHGAPDELCRRALAAAQDERRHAAQMERLAAELGAAPEVVALDEVGTPGLLELARDNAVQGCVGETWAALLARHQADAAGPARVREVMAAIAADETEHAELAWAIDGWLCARLTAEQRAEVVAARMAACAALRERVARGVDDPALQDLGVPRRATAVALHDGLARALWLAA